MCALETAALDFFGSSSSTQHNQPPGASSAGLLPSSTSAALLPPCAVEVAAASSAPATPAPGALGAGTPLGGSQAPSVQSGGGLSSQQSSATGSVASSQGPNPGAGDSSSVASSTSTWHAGGGGSLFTEEHVQRAIDNLEDEFQKDFIRKCLNKDPTKRPSARECLFHPVLFEVHSLKLTAAHHLVERAEIESSKSD